MTGCLKGRSVVKMASSTTPLPPYVPSGLIDVKHTFDNRVAGKLSASAHPCPKAGCQYRTSALSLELAICSVTRDFT
jgi:hypothetical protein